MPNIEKLRSVTHQWYIVHCRHLHERQAAQVLEERLGLIIYLPEMRRRVHRQLQLGPFFPGYLFARADLTEIAPSHINAVPGVIRLVTFDEVPQPVPEVVVEEIRLQVEDLNSRGGWMPHSFRPGDTLRFKTGSFQGMEATFLGPMKPSERVRVLIEFLGSLRKMEVDVDQLEQGLGPSAPRRQRRTRGKGRRIKGQPGSREPEC